MKQFLIVAALLAAFLGTFSAWPSQAQENRTIVSAQGSPYLVDFVARESKQADLRLNIARMGLDAAFSDWLVSAHPAAYHNALCQSASRALPASFTPTATSRSNGSCCIMASGCCPMCPACCEQKSCTKGCCNLSACTTRPDCCKS